MIATRNMKIEENEVSLTSATITIDTIVVNLHTKTAERDERNPENGPIIEPIRREHQKREEVEASHHAEVSERNDQNARLLGGSNKKKRQEEIRWLAQKMLNVELVLGNYCRTSQMVSWICSSVEYRIYK